jgi:hypothetical protein
MICDFLIFFWQIISHVLKKKIQDHISIIMCLGGFKALLYRKMCDFTTIFFTILKISINKLKIIIRLKVRNLQLFIQSSGKEKKGRG